MTHHGPISRTGGNTAKYYPEETGFYITFRKVKSTNWNESEYWVSIVLIPVSIQLLASPMQPVNKYKRYINQITPFDLLMMIFKKENILTK